MPVPPIDELMEKHSCEIEKKDYLIRTGEIEATNLYATNAKLRAALERLIKDYEDETGEKAMAARTTLAESQ